MRRRRRSDGAIGLKLTEFFQRAVPIAAGGLGAAEDQVEGFGALAIEDEGGAEGVLGKLGGLFGRS